MWGWGVVGKVGSGAGLGVVGKVGSGVGLGDSREGQNKSEQQNETVRTRSKYTYKPAPKRMGERKCATKLRLVLVSYLS